MTDSIIYLTISFRQKSQLKSPVNDSGRLKVIAIVTGNIKYSLAICKCACGNFHVVRLRHIREQAIRSCGCLGHEGKGKGPLKHGGAAGKKKTTEYSAWCAMISRCTNPGDHAYAYYGGQGVTVCTRWRHDFPAFLADVGNRPPGLTLDRHPNNQGNYEPGNVRWATMDQQGKNRKSNRYETFHGRTMCLKDWSEVEGIRYQTLVARLNNSGWTFERAITTPINTHMRNHVGSAIHRAGC